MSEAKYVIRPYTSNQEVFDLAARHLLTQMKRSEVPIGEPNAGKCLYRGDAGCKCAVGVLIPDELYNPDMDVGSSSMDVIIEKFPTITKLFENASPSLLTSLQRVHDSHKPREWAVQLRIRAKIHSLNTAVIDELAPLPDRSAEDAALIAEMAQ